MAAAPYASGTVRDTILMMGPPERGVALPRNEDALLANLDRIDQTLKPVNPT